MPATLTVPARFNGPPSSGNGGYTAALVARALGAGAGPAEVTLKAPPPLDRPLAVEPSGGGIAVRDGETVVATAAPARVEVDAPEPVTFEAAAAAGERGPFRRADTHPFPTCFVCGPERAAGDGMRVFAGPVEGDPSLFAATWEPPASAGAAGGRVPDELVWAALDCPTSAPVANDPAAPDYRPVVLARLAVRVDRPVAAGERHVVLSWPLAVEGRKREAAAALYAADGALCAVSRALWIELRAD